MGRIGDAQQFCQDYTQVLLLNPGQNEEIKGENLRNKSLKKKTHIRPNYHGRTNFPRLPYFIEQLEYDTGHT